MIEQYLVWIVGAAALAVGFVVGRASGRAAARSESLMGVPGAAARPAAPAAVPADLPPEVLAAARSGQKIEAIKLLREATGLSLTEAKEAVERLPGMS